MHDGPVFFSFLITFMFASLFWFPHHALLNFVIELRLRLVVLNLAFLLFVSLLPFSVGMLGHFLRNPLVQTFYFGNQLAISLMLLWQSGGALKLITEPDGREAGRFRIRVTALPIGAALAAAAAWLNPNFSFYAFLIVVLASRGYSVKKYGRT